QSAQHLVDQRVDQVVEVVDAQRGVVHSAVDIDVFQALVVDAVADTDGGDVDAVVGDEIIPVSRRGVIQGMASGAGLLVGVAVADEDDLVVPPQQRGVGAHGLLDGRGEVGGGVYRTHATFQRVDGVHQGGEVGGIGHRREGSRDIGKCHDLD